MPGNYKKCWNSRNKSTKKRSTQFRKGHQAYCYRSEKSATETEKILFAEAKIKPIPIGDSLYSVGNAASTSAKEHNYGLSS